MLRLRGSRQVLQELSDGFAERRMKRVRRDFRERLENERALMHARVRNLEPCFPDDHLLIKEEVKIQGSWTPALGAQPALPGFYFEQQLQELPGREFDFEFGCTVKVIRLGRAALRHGVKKAADAPDHHVRRVVQCRDS